ncbi:MAG: hypothetical protein EZS28_008453 [Streblomastix strix]|uniref:Uncharacterized protein n=1 Tax=Streblomastix strix TaxID=222440 RepID=A0A5J4WMB4_9EUKA|nr:MAG: hypothetical protein EZS28_008453 [Streblomastix strix]
MMIWEWSAFERMCESEQDKNEVGQYEDEVLILDDSDEDDEDSYSEYKRVNNQKDDKEEKYVDIVRDILRRRQMKDNITGL